MAWSGGLVSFRSFGLRYATDYLQDGTPTGSRNWGTIGWRPPGIDSIEEFRTETNNSSAKLARPSSVITTTRAGTNQVHGSVFETARNNGFGVARARQDAYLKPPPLVRNEFGASLGGPVYIPKLYNGRNRTFFFASYEAMRLISNSTISITVPTAAMRQGDFSGLVDSQGRRYQLYNPWTTDPKTWERQPYLNNQIPINQISPLTKALYAITPLPTLPSENPLAGPNWQGPVFDNQRNYTVTVRSVHRRSDRDQLFFRYTHATHSTEKVQAGGAARDCQMGAPGNSGGASRVATAHRSSWIRLYPIRRHCLVGQGRAGVGERPGQRPGPFADRLGEEPALARRPICRAQGNQGNRQEGRRQLRRCG